MFTENNNAGESAPNISIFTESEKCITLHRLMWIPTFLTVDADVLIGADAVIAVVRYFDTRPTILTRVGVARKLAEFLDVGFCHVELVENSTNCRRFGIAFKKVSIDAVCRITYQAVTTLSLLSVM